MISPSASDIITVPPFSTYQVDQSTWLVHSLDTHRVLECDTYFVRILMACQGARTLEQHVSGILTCGAGDDADAVRQSLLQLFEEGLLRTCTNVGSEIVPAMGHSRRPGVVAIVTADRPQQLRRCLQSLVTHCHTHGNAPRFIIVDNSRDCKNHTANIGTVDELRRATGQRVELLGPDEVSTIRDAAADNGLSDLAEFMLGGGTIGASRNIILLSAAGEDVVMVDDDMVCQPWHAAEYTERVVLAGHADARHTAFFSTREAARFATQAADVDLLAACGVLLGRRVAELARRTDVDPSGACAHLAAALDGQTPLRVRATFVGLAGDAGMYCPCTLLFSTGRWKAALASDPLLYQNAFRYRECHRIATSYVVTHDSKFMAGCVALDNASIMPPFMPFGRNEDGVFGATLSYCDPDTVYGHVPFGILHESDRPSEYPDQVNRAATETRIAEVLIAFMHMHPAPIVETSVSARMSYLGGVFKHLGSIGVDEFRTQLTRASLEKRQRELNQIERMVSGHEYPDFWVSDLIEYRETLLNSMTDEYFFIPCEFRSCPSLHESLNALRRYFRMLGDGFRVWANVWEAHRASQLIPT